MRRAPLYPHEISWDPAEGRAVKEDFEGFDAFIHLSGEPLSLSRWSREKKEKILFSRTVSTWFLSQIASLLFTPPKIFISVSAIGFYGDRGDEVLTEASSAGCGFLAQVCCEWEKAARSIERRGARIVHPRFGMVLGAKGGALSKMLFPYKLGLGGALGSGQQWMSWIALEDLCSSMDFILHSQIEGPVNFVSPHPVRQKDFARALASFLHRPLFLSLPSWILRLRFGQMADEILLASCRAYPQKLIESGFSFRYSDLSEALHHCLSNQL